MNDIIQDHNFPKYEEYLDCMVAFIDILGFDSRVRNIKSREDFFEVGKLLYTLKETAKGFSKENTILKNFQVTAISDSVIVTMPYHDPGCAMALITILHNFQYELIATSFETLTRGYITRGNVFHRDDIIFGLGYSEAYRKEREAGHAPRIVVDPTIVKDGKEKVSRYKGKEKVDHIFNYITEDTCDGYYFIDYLKPVGVQTVLPQEQLRQERMNIKQFLERNLLKHSENEKIYRKYKWLENYLQKTEHYFEI